MKRKGLTLAELLIALAILGVMSPLPFPNCRSKHGVIAPNGLETGRTDSKTGEKPQQ